MRKSIGKKINILLAVSLMSLSVIMLVANLIEIFRNTTQNSEIMFSKGCETQVLQLNEQFKFIEQSVKDIYDISEKLRPRVKISPNGVISEDYISEFEDTAVTIGNNTEGALAVYYRLNPAVTNSGDSGFFYVRNTLEEEHIKVPNTDLTKFDRDDFKHVGWYYVPVDNGRPIWMAPYYNANTEIEIISYVMPIFEDDTVIGIIGMDMDFNSIKNIAEEVDIYESCGAVLCSLESNTIFYNKCDVFGNTIPEEIRADFLEKKCSGSVNTYEADDVEYCAYFDTLQNGMKFLVYAKRSEIFSQSRDAIFNSTVIFIVVFTVTIILSIRTGEMIVQPINDITEAAKKYANGEWDITIQCDTEDELQDLTKNIMIMAEKTKKSIEYINDMAKKDGLTGLRNKTDYLQYIDTVIQKNISEKKPFAVVVFDVNNLKIVNDNLGHEKGDELLLSASAVICKQFSHSPVFRIGGDEFVAIADSGDYEKRHSLVEDFKAKMFTAKDNKDIMTTCVACGIADFPEEANEYEELFAIADHRMYENKVILKNGMTPR